MPTPRKTKPGPKPKPALDGKAASEFRSKVKAILAECGLSLRQLPKYSMQKTPISVTALYHAMESSRRSRDRRLLTRTAWTIYENVNDALLAIGRIGQDAASTRKSRANHPTLGIRRLIEEAGRPWDPTPSEVGATVIIFPGEAANLAAALAEQITGAENVRGVTGISKRNARAVAHAIRRYLLPYEDIFKGELGKRIGRFLTTEIPSWQGELNQPFVNNLDRFFGQFKNGGRVPKPVPNR